MTRFGRHFPRTFILPALLIGIGAAGAAHGERAASAGAVRVADAAAGVALVNKDSMPHRLAAYKAAVLTARFETAESERYSQQAVTIDAMSVEQFQAAFPGGDYRATLDHLDQQAQIHRAAAQEAIDNSALRLNDVTAGRRLPAQELAELHVILGL